MSNNKLDTGGSFLGWVFAILLLLKWRGYIVYDYNFGELSWGWVIMPLMMGIWAGLTRPSSY